jgi:hypothetical protein
MRQLSIAAANSRLRRLTGCARIRPGDPERQIGSFREKVNETGVKGE